MVKIDFTYCCLSMSSVFCAVQTSSYSISTKHKESRDLFTEQNLLSSSQLKTNKEQSIDS